jgi:hypothetical protein
MKTQNIVLGVCWVLLTAFFSSCAQSIENAITPPLETTLLPASTATSEPSLTPQPTNSSTPTLTPTIIPTLPVEEARTKLLQLLSDNSSCRLPCLWGITPGMSSYKEAQSIFMPLTSISVLTSFRPEGGAIFPVYANGDLDLYTGVGFNVDTQYSNRVVKMIGFIAEAHKPLAQGGYEDIFDSKFFGEKVSAYSLPHVLSEQGIPSSVMIETAGGPLTRGGTGGFDILLLYPAQGILVNYRTEMHLTGSKVRGCPPNAYVRMELYPPGQPDTFWEGLKQTDWAVKMTGYKPLEEITSMSVQEFYDTFREPTDKCIETPANLWPTPEP